LGFGAVLAALAPALGFVALAAAVLARDAAFCGAVLVAAAACGGSPTGAPRLLLRCCGRDFGNDPKMLGGVSSMLAVSPAACNISNKRRFAVERKKNPLQI
jgi:hypothetical protein